MRKCAFRVVMTMQGAGGIAGPVVLVTVLMAFGHDQVHDVPEVGTPRQEHGRQRH
jgi:hypothetical protein